MLEAEMKEKAQNLCEILSQKV